ncbi:hypothetical protein MFUM_940072 [Methylacidiphilum fumariolicum SolV]|uniref:Uncharacterized protein n=2 Tax=Candidatus Methylacidiphilum fumarolicum TaxID=591154 RepID=I0K128_METFB|nr:conserved protein of unknown function [Candidatus Methylacidiphilum fumarolicum]CCG93197.1 hypothetical protein MFUM_940072 [Methylacidiphilum fumariolicum SolV]
MECHLEKRLRGYSLTIRTNEEREYDLPCHLFKNNVSDWLFKEGWKQNKGKK